MYQFLVIRIHEATSAFTIVAKQNSAGWQGNGMSKRIIILGTGATCVYCDFGWKDGKSDPDVEVYGVNGAYTIPKIMPPDIRNQFKMDKLFMTDYTWSDTGTLNFHPGEINEFAKTYGTQIVSLHPHKIGKHVIKDTRYPWRRICHKFHNNYMTDTICYMIAYALDKYTVEAKNSNGVVRLELTEPLTIALYGVDMATTLEYYISKCGVEFWLGQAFALGCEITITNGSVIMMHPRGVMYGFRPKQDLSKIDFFGILRQEEEHHKLIPQGPRSGRRRMDLSS